MNYLQTDDRDEYFAQFNNKKASKPRKLVLYTITDTFGNILLKNKSGFRCIRFTKIRFNLTKGQVKCCWQQLLQKDNLIIKKYIL